MNNWTTLTLKRAKDLALCHPLEDLNGFGFVHFYTHLTVFSPLHIGLTPFDPILLQYSHVSLCLPGVGERRYIEMLTALYTVLEHLLPTDHPKVGATLDSLMGVQHDEFHRLWNMMSTFLPVFCPFWSPKETTWAESVTTYDAGNAIIQLAKLW